LPFPPNPSYGDGATRRRIDLLNSRSTTLARLIDTFHEMDCKIRHDGQRVTAIEGVMHRYPTTLCPGAASVLQAKVGMSLGEAGSRFYEPSFQRQNCTHLLDLAWLAVNHARRGAPERVYEAYVPDERAGPVVVEVLCDGNPVHQWTVSRGIVISPRGVANLSLLKGFWVRASELLDGDALEAALVLSRTYLIAIGRAYDTQAWAGRPVADNVPLRDKCYAYSSQHGDAGRFVGGNVRDFQDRIVSKA
jgi:hypothetical protein